MLDVGCWTLDVGRWMLDVGCWTLDVGRWMLDVGCWTLDVGENIPKVENFGMFYFYFFCISSKASSSTIAS